MDKLTISKEGEIMPYGKILMIDEDVQLRRLVADHLESKGMEVALASRIDDYALSAAERASVILLSSSAIAGDAGSSIARLRGELNTPVIILTATGAQTDAMLYFRIGADQVVQKPFNIAEISLRVKALLRRCEDTNYYKETSASFKGITVDLKEYSVMIDGQPVELSPKEIELLFLLVSRPEKTFSRSEISSRVWGRILSDNRTIAVHINRIKSKLGGYAAYITSVRGVGYKITERISE